MEGEKGARDGMGRDNGRVRDGWIDGRVEIMGEMEGEEERAMGG